MIGAIHRLFDALMRMMEVKHVVRHNKIKQIANDFKPNLN